MHYFAYLSCERKFPRVPVSAMSKLDLGRVSKEEAGAWGKYKSLLIASRCSEFGVRALKVHEAPQELAKTLGKGAFSMNEVREGTSYRHEAAPLCESLFVGFPATLYLAS